MNTLLHPNISVLAEFRRNGPFDLEILTWERDNADPALPPLRFLSAGIYALHTAMGGHPEVASGLVITNDPDSQSVQGGTLRTVLIRPNTLDPNRAEYVYGRAWPLLRAEIRQILGEFGQISEENGQISAIWGPNLENLSLEVSFPRIKDSELTLDAPTEVATAKIEE